MQNDIHGTMPDERDNPGALFLERKLATILSADVAEFSRLMGEDEEQALRIFRGHKQVFESLVAMHRGRVFNTAGDAILAEFGSAVEAVRCATDIQAALRTRNDQLSPSRQVRFRIGINLGDVMLHGQDLLGDGVNVAARLQTAAEPGGICISGSVHDQVSNKLSISFQSLGEMNFKNIQRPVRTFSIREAEGVGALPFKPRTKRSSPARSIAAGLLLLALLAGGGYWAFTANERNKAEPAHAVVTAAPPDTTPPEGHPAESVTVADSWPFSITLDDDVPANGSDGQTLSFTLQDDFRVGDAVVMAKGAKVSGSIIGGKKILGIWNRKMNFRLFQADAVDGQKLNVRATARHAATGPASRPFDTGKGSRPKELAAVKGTEYIGYTDGEQTVSVQALSHQ
jgi:class 3 adenylate cyclase